MNTINEAIDRGMALLDERIPNWRDQIDLCRLDLRSTSSCVLGQLFEDRRGITYDSGFTIGCMELGIAENPSRYGFDNNIGLDPVPYEDLTEAWKVRLEGHHDYPHEPGRLPGCPGCEARCHCDPDPSTTACVWVLDSHNAAGDRFGKHLLEAQS